MQKCSYCGADLPENTRFCGKCGSVQGALPAETPWFPLNDAPPEGDALIGSVQASTPGAPVVHGTPQISSIPSVTGSSASYTNAPINPSAQGASASLSQPAQGAASTSAGQPAQGAHAPLSQPAQAQAGAPASQPANAPAIHSAQGPANAPFSQPVQRPVNPSYPQTSLQTTHYPPAQPGTQHQSSHEHHRHHTHRTQSTATSVTNVAGGSAIKTIIIMVTVVAVVAAGGIAAAAHFLSHPQPRISITSNYKVGNTPAGAPGTSLHISGQQFSSNSAITILLDGHVAPGNPSARSDANGNFSADVTITSAWSPGPHTLTARDASNDSTQQGISVTIVQPGQANTPGPDGAPADDASFKLNITIQVADPYVGEPFAHNPVLIITGHPDPQGGTVCSPLDNGQPFTYTGTTYNHGTSYTETDTASCSGTYKAGQISYIETDTSAKVSGQSNGVNVTCALNNPAVILQLTGAYAGNNTFSGTINYPYVSYPCDQQGVSYWQETLKGTWTGTIVKQ